MALTDCARRSGKPRSRERTIVTIAILGGGALGTLLAASFAPYAQTRLLVRDATQARAIALRGGVAVEGEATRDIAVFANAPQLALAAIDVLVIAVKTYATLAALAPLRAHLAPSAAIVSIQNGIDAPGDIRNSLGRTDRVALAPTTEAAMLVEPGLVRHAAHGATLLGWISGAARSGDDTLVRLAALMTRAGLANEIVAPIEARAWQKLVASLAINPTTALAGVLNGDLLAVPALRERAASLAREAAVVARASGIVLPYADPVAYAESVMRETAPNRSSMLRDLECGRRTEIEAIAGTIVRRAAALGIAVPHARAALDEVRARTKA